MTEVIFELSPKDRKGAKSFPDGPNTDPVYRQTSMSNSDQVKAC